MKVYFLLSALVLFLLISFINGCRKEAQDTYTPAPPSRTAPAPYVKGGIINESFKETFDGNYFLTLWNFSINYSEPYFTTYWSEEGNPVKVPGIPIDPVYDKKFAYLSRPDSIKISTWMLTPPMQLKNGDILSFVTVADNNRSSSSVHGLEVRMNETDNSMEVGNSLQSVGKFTKLLGAITNYPRTWTRFQYVISGLAAPMLSRIAFRYYMPDSKPGGSIGIDDITFTKQ
jgi:hypothetical protein